MTNVTVRQRLENQLFGMGLFPNQATEVVERAMTDECNESMQGRWNEPAEAYPVQLYTVLWMLVMDHALAWIDENAPLAWYRPLFVRKEV